MASETRTDGIKVRLRAATKLIRNSSIRSKLVAMLLVPIAGILVFAGLQITSRYSQLSENQSIERMTELVERSSAAVHEMQKERGSSALYLGAEGATYGPELAAQRELLDAELAALEELLAETPAASYGSEFDVILADAYERLEGLADHRAAVDAVAISNAVNLEYYTPIVQDLLHVTTQMEIASTDREIAELALAADAVAQGKEAAGLERAVVANGLASGAFEPEAMRTFLSLVAIQDTYQSIFLDHATDEQVVLAQEVTSAPIFATVDEYRAAVVSGDTTGHDAAAWFDAATERLGFITQLQDQAIDTLANRAGELAADAKSSLILGIVYMALVAGVGLGIALAVSQSLTRRIKAAARTAEKLKEGDVNVDVLHHEARDEIGRMESAFGRTTTYLQEAADVARRIADGDLSAEFEVRSENDVLGNAMADMTRRLREVVGRALVVTESVEKGAETLAQSSRESASAAGEVANAIGEVAQGATSQSRVVDDVARAAAEIASEAETAADAVAAVASASSNAESIAGHGHEQLEHVSVAMESISHSFDDVAENVSEIDVNSKRVEEIVDLIRTIAEQTNLLALNAAIEAARAGESGRGFAVVAAEVKSLAEEAATSTEQIAGIVGEMRKSVVDAVGSVEVGRDQVASGASVVAEAGEAFDTIAGAVDTIAASVNAVTESTERIGSGTHSISQGMNELSLVAESNSATSEEVAAVGEQAAATAQEIGDTASELSASSDELADAMARFRLHD